MRQTLVLTGDIHLGHVADPAEPFALVRDVLGEADVVFGNLEGCLYDPSVTVDYKPGWHHVGPEPAPALMHGGFHALGCANNVNFGAEAIMATVARLDEMGIAHTGAGADRAAARAPAIVERGGVRFGFLQYTSVFWPLGHEAADGSPGVAAILAHTAYRPNQRIAEMPGGPPIVVTWPDAEYLDAFRRDVAALRERVDFLVASFHWGISGSVETADYQVAIAHAAIDSGADLVMGHGPHEIQAVEIYGGKPIFYSLGNFFFGEEPLYDFVGMAAFVELEDGNAVEVRCVPVRPNPRSQTRIRAFVDEPEAGKSLETLSRRFDTTIKFRDRDAVVWRRG